MSARSSSREGRNISRAAFLAAVEAGHVKTLRALLEEDPYLLRLPIEVDGVAGCTPLHLAVARGQPAATQALIAAGADLAARNADGRTALDLAAQRRSGLRDVPARAGATATYAVRMRSRHRRLTRAEQREETRRRLLDAAISVFIRRGLHEATLEEISEAAGYSRGAVYSNFSGKDDLLLTVFEERIEPRLRAIAEPMIEATSAAEQAEASRRLVHALLTEERAYLQLLLEFWGFAARHRQVRQRFAGVRRRRRALIAAMIDERVQRRDGGLAGAESELLAAGFVAMTIGVLFEALIDRDLDAEEVQARVFELIARGAGRESGESPRSTRGSAR